MAEALSRREIVRRFRSLGYAGPFSGGKHQFMTKGSQKIRIPNPHIGDMSLYEASEFWDEHDFTEFEDVKEVKELHFAFKRKKYIPVDMMLYKKIKQKAKRLGKTEDTLVTEWLKEKVG